VDAHFEKPSRQIVFEPWQGQNHPPSHPGANWFRLGSYIGEWISSEGRQEIYAAGQKPEGEITEVSYLFAKPSDLKPAVKKNFVTKVDDDFACGVGYYK
jgi:hypothetical protein